MNKEYSEQFLRSPDNLLIKLILVLNNCPPMEFEAIIVKIC